MSSFQPPPPPVPAPAAATTSSSSSTSGKPRELNHITNLASEPYPSPSALAEATTVHTQGPFRISSRKLPILKSGPIDAMSARLGIPVPEMIFGDNLMSITHIPSGWSIQFEAEPALDLVDKTGAQMLRVAYAREWSSSREKTSAGISDVVKPYDWSYSTTYKGTEHKPEAGKGLEETKGVEIPLELLKRRDPILFHDDVVLYESELDDNGISLLNVKCRVMPQRMLLLCRLFMRLDNVLVRVRDTRVYVDFEEEKVIREYTAREDGFDNVKRSLMMEGLRPDELTIALRDSNQVAGLLKVVEHVVESVDLRS